MLKEAKELLNSFFEGRNVGFHWTEAINKFYKEQNLDFDLIYDIILLGDDMNTGKLMIKLQKALITKGKPIKIDRIQFYSDDKGRMITKYVFKEKRLTRNRKNEQVYKDVNIYESYSQIECVKFLAQLYKESG